MKHALTLVILATWLGMVALLVQKQAPLPSTPLSTLTVGDAPASAGTSDEWFGVYQADRKIGHAHRRVTPMDGGFRVEDESHLALTVLGSAQTVTTSLSAETDADWGLRRFRFALASPAGRYAATGTAGDGQLVLRHGPNGDGTEMRVPLDAPLRLPSTLRPRLAAANPAPGARFSDTVLNPLTLARDPVVTVVEGRETIVGPDGPEDTLRIAEEHNGLRARAWLAADGRVLREEGLLGFVLKREPRDTALAGSVDRAPADLAVATRIPMTGDIPGARDLAVLTVRVRGAAAGRIPDDPPRQRHTAGVLRIEREAPPGPADGVTPVPAALAAYLQPAPFIESDDAGIQAAARAATGDATEPADRARRLLAWVGRSLTQAPSLTVPSAREVLRTKRGDCNEHAVLLAALARAAGIPARVVAGAVYLDDAFYYHAWTELWLGRWITADPVFGQFPADATHVKLLEGGPERHLALAALLGKLDFTAVEAGS